MRVSFETRLRLNQSGMKKIENIYGHEVRHMDMLSIVQDDILFKLNPKPQFVIARINPTRSTQTMKDEGCSA